MVKLIKREGKYVLPSDKIDYSKEVARTKIHNLFGTEASYIKFGAIRRDGTRGVSFLINGQKVSFSYLTDLSGFECLSQYKNISSTILSEISLA